MLCQELANEQSPTAIRQSAGLMMKNQLQAKEFERQNEYSIRWMSIDANLRNEIKHGVIVY
jgi:importin subunit beta-1